MNRLTSRTLALCTAALAAAFAAACGAGDRSGPAVTELTELSSPAAPGSAEPNVFGVPGGPVYMSWLEPTEPAEAASTRRGMFALRVATLDLSAADASEPIERASVAPTPGAGGGAPEVAPIWSRPVTVAVGDDFFVNWADFPSVIALPDGTLAAHWLVRSGPGTYAYDVHLALSHDGGATWSESIVPHRDGTQTEHGFVSLFPWEDGRLAAAWLDGRKFPQEGGGHGGGGEMTLQHTVVGGDGSLDAETMLDGRVCDCCQTSAAITQDGPVVVYRDRSEEEIRDISIVRHVDHGQWTEPAKVHDDGWEIHACPVNGPAVDADGPRVAVAWFTMAQDTARVRLAFSEDAGATFGEPIRIDDGDPEGRVDIQMLPDGTTLVSWLENAGEGDGHVRVRRVESDGRAGPSMTIGETSSARPSGFPHMALAGDRVVFAWTVPDRPSRIEFAAAKWR